jgi:hypothetical protein
MPSYKVVGRSLKFCAISIIHHLVPYHGLLLLLVLRPEIRRVSGVQRSSIGSL